MDGKIAALILFFLVFSDIGMAATVHGDVYDINFNKLTNSIVEVNSVPKQSFIVKDSGYNFKLNPGNYTIKAYYLKNKELIAYTQENLLIKDLAGDYNLDLILFPHVEDENLTGIELDIIDYLKPETNNKFNILLVFLSLISILVVAYLIMSFRRTMRNKEKIHEAVDYIEKAKLADLEEKKDEFLEKAYSIIKEEKRINQKDLRKKMMLSEAKISLIITQLESEGKVKKIKKGRGNIIIFAK
ncbi:MAG: hypothetical protein AABW41_01095 [Nanoarchaeota archaeon]